MKLYEIRYDSPEDGQTCIVDVVALDIHRAISLFWDHHRGIEIRAIYKKSDTVLTS